MNTKHRFFPSVLTDAEAHSWHARLNMIRNELFRKGNGLHEAAFNEQVEKIISAYIPQGQFESWKQYFAESQKDFSKEIEHIISDLETYKHCEITVAKSLSTAVSERLVEWFSEQGLSKIILHVKVDEKIGAGVVISFNGKILDYSLGKKIVGELKRFA